MTIKSTLKSLGTIVALVVVVGGGWYFWQNQQPEKLLESIAYGNGRIEATEYDIATKLPGRLVNVQAQEGEMVLKGQTLAIIDTDDLKAQLREANAGLRVANESRKYALAIVEQYESQLTLAQTELNRSLQLLKKGLVSQETVDKQSTISASAKATLKASNVKVVQSDAGIEAAQARIQRLESNIADSTLIAPIDARVLYRLAEPGEVLGSGGKVFSLLDLTDVYMSIYLPTSQAGKIAIGSEARIILDAIPQYTLPAKVTFVSAQAQFTPKSVETRDERDKLMFRVKVKLDSQLLKDHIEQVKTGVPGVAYVLLAPEAKWPTHLQVRVPE
jgi:HlyD family secretion protein